METKYCKFCDGYNPYVNQEFENYRTHDVTVRNYCAVCHNLIEEYETNPYKEMLKQKRCENIVSHH